MDFYRETIKNAPPMIDVPDEFQDRDLEVIFLPLDTNGNERKTERVDRDAKGYPLGFFEATAGSLPDFPDREPQPEFDVRDEIA